MVEHHVSDSRLVAERLLCLQMNTDGQVQKCIFEVLHRETTNVVVVSTAMLENENYSLSSQDMEIDFLDAIDTKPDYSWLDAPPNGAAPTTNALPLPLPASMMKN